MSCSLREALYPAVRPRDIRSFALPVPPLAEQRRIVSKIESLQERSSRVRVALSEVGPLLEQFRQSVLAAAFSGRLTADWRERRRMGIPVRRPPGVEDENNSGKNAQATEYEPASELLARIRTTRDAKTAATRKASLHKFLRSRRQNGKETFVVFESRGKKEDAELELEFRRVCDGQNFRGERMNLNCVIASKLTNSSGLQLADLVARPIGRKLLKPDQQNRAFDILEAKFDRSPQGDINGRGLRVYP